jgi:hypothetical protein
MAAKSVKRKSVRNDDELDSGTQNRGPFDEPTLDDFMLNNHPDDELLPQNGMPPLGWLKKTFKTKSAVIRYLTLERKFPVKEVAKHLGLRYQMVRNVSTKYLKRGANEDWKLPEGVIDPSIGAERPAGAVVSSPAQTDS